MTNTVEFKVALMRAGMTTEDLSKKIGLSQQSISYKVNNKREFTSSEISKISDALNLSVEERDTIFFAKQVD